MARGTTSTSEESHAIPALIRKCTETAESGAGHMTCRGTGSASREIP